MQPGTSEYVASAAINAQPLQQLFVVVVAVAAAGDGFIGCIIQGIAELVFRTRSGAETAVEEFHQRSVDGHVLRVLIMGMC